MKLQKLAARLAHRLGLSVADLSALMIAFSLYLFPLPCSGEQAQPTEAGQTLYSGETRCAALSPDGSTLVACVADGIWMINLSTGGRSFLKRRAPESVVFAPDGKTMVVGDAQGFIHLYDTRSWKLLWPSTPDHDGPVDRTAISSDGRWLVTASSKASSVHRWLMPSLQPASQISVDDADMNITSLAYAPDSKNLVAIGEAGPFYVFTSIRDALGLANFLRQPAVKQANPTFQSVAFLDNERFAVGGYDSPVNIWSLKSWRVEKQLPAPQTRVLAMAPLGDSIVTGGEGADATVLNSEGVVTQILQGTTGTRTILVDPNGRVITAGKYGVKRFDR